MPRSNHTVLTQESEGLCLLARIQPITGVGRCIVLEHGYVEDEEIHTCKAKGSIVMSEAEFRTLIEEVGPIVREGGI